MRTKKEKVLRRTLTVSTVTACKVETANGQATIVAVEPFSVNGKLTEERATKEVEKRYGKGAYAVTAITAHQEQREMSISDFIKYSVPVPAESIH